MRPNQNGITLTEFMISNSIALATVGLGAVLLTQMLQRIHHIALKNQLHQAMEDHVAEIRGAVQHAAEYALPLQIGYPTTLPYLHQNAYPGEPRNSCLLLSGYDQKPTSLRAFHASTFGYRLRAQSLEKQRSVKSCEGRWERITDPEEIRVHHFELTLLCSKKLMKLQLELSLTKHPAIIMKTERYLCLKDY